MKCSVVGSSIASALLIGFICLCVFAEGDKDMQTPHGDSKATTFTPATSRPPAERGAEKAKKDIAQGIMRILYYGKPWSVRKPLKDDESGLPVEIVEGCDVTREFAAETDAYNKGMRETAGRKKESKGRLGELKRGAWDKDGTEPAAPRGAHFPKDRSIGKYAIFRPDQHADDITEGKLRNARGDVEVPAGMQLFLMFADETLKSDEKPIDLSSLDRLRPTDIQAFTVQPFVRVSAEELNRLRRHVSLRVCGS